MIWCFLLSLGNGIASAQRPDSTSLAEGWSLGRCVEYAQAHSPEVQEAALDLKGAEIQRKSAWWRFSPTASARASMGYNFGRAIDYGSNTVSNDLRSTSVSIGANLSLFEGLGRIWNLKAEKLAVASSEARRAVVMQNLAISVTQAYYGLLFQQEVLTLRQSQLSQIEKQVELGRKRVAAGSLAEGAILDLEAQLAGEQGQLVESENSVGIAELQLRQILNFEGEESFSVAPPERQTLDSVQAVEMQGYESMAELVLSVHPSIKVAELEIQRAEYGVKMSRSGWYPRLSMSASYGSGARHFLQSEGHPPEDPFTQQLKDNASKSLNFSLSVPLWDGYSTRARVQHAKINLLRAQLARDNSQRQLYKALQNAYADVVSTHRRWLASEVELKANREAFRWATKRLEAGAINAYDYGQAKTKLAQAEVRNLQAKYEYMLKAKILSIYQGQ